MYFVRDIYSVCDMSLRDEIKEYISYRNRVKRGYIAFEQTVMRRKCDTMYDTPNVVHGCRCIKTGVLLDTFTPIREDFLKK